MNINEIDHKVFVVQGDLDEYNNGEYYNPDYDGPLADIGYAVINRKHLHYHWVKFPDGQLRRNYNFREVDIADADILEAFGLLPLLEVRYRPFSKILTRVHKFVIPMLFASMASFLLTATLITIGVIYGGGELSLSNTVYSTLMLIVPILIVSALGSIVSGIGTYRYRRYTKDDIKKYDALRSQRVYR
jgi:hypothetical protein